MNVQVRTDPVTSSMSVIKTILPERPSSHRVELISSRSGRENSCVQGDVRLKNPCKCSSLEHVCFAGKQIRSSDIGRTIEVVCS